MALSKDNVMLRVVLLDLDMSTTKTHTDKCTSVYLHHVSLSVITASCALKCIVVADVEHWIIYSVFFKT